MLPAKWNSKKGKNDNLDWQQNLLVGVKIALGKTRKHITIKEPAPVVEQPKSVVEKKKPAAVVEKKKPTAVVAEKKPTAVVAEKKPEPVVEKVPEMPEVKVFFAASSSKLTPAEAEKLQPVVDYLKKYGKRNVVISGYASTDGKKAYNQRLSERRAKAVERWLIDNGIDAARIKTEGKGEVDSGNSKDSRSAVAKITEK